MFGGCEAQRCLEGRVLLRHFSLFGVEDWNRDPFGLRSRTFVSCRWDWGGCQVRVQSYLRFGGTAGALGRGKSYPNARDWDCHVRLPIHWGARGLSGAVLFHSQTGCVWESCCGAGVFFQKHTVCTSTRLSGRKRHPPSSHLRRGNTVLLSWAGHGGRVTRPRRSSSTMAAQAPKHLALNRPVKSRWRELDTREPVGAHTRMMRKRVPGPDMTQYLRTWMNMARLTPCPTSYDDWGPMFRGTNWGPLSRLIR